MNMTDKLVKDLTMSKEDILQMEENPQGELHLDRYGRMWISYMKNNHPKKVMQLELENSLYKTAMLKSESLRELIQDIIENTKSKEIAPTDLMERTQWENQIRQAAEELAISEMMTV